MNKLFLSLATLTLFACSNDDPQYKDITAENILGTWIIKTIDNQKLYTDEYFVCRFNSDGSEDYLSIEDDGNGSSTVKYTDNTTYKIENSTLYMYSDIVELEFPASMSTGELCGESGDILTYTETINIQDDVDQNANRTFTAIRSTTDYSTDIIGMWEGTVIEGDTSEPFDNIRLDFRADGKFSFYKQESDDSWTLLEQANIFYIMGNILATQWDEDNNTTAAESWVIDIENDNMSWRADREGLDYTAGFDLVRVVQ